MTNKEFTQATKKPELLMPAGNMATFKAAIAGGADAVYLGTKNFNARSRANNFNWTQLANAVETAHKYNVKVYVTLNTVIKNTEIPELIETLNFLNQIRPDAIIIQDWGVYYIAKKFFPKLKLHASTQMAIHSNQGANHAQRLGIKRVILARELTLQELQVLKTKTTAELEIFVHGALCYSFSGMCLYSSFNGGQGANRGLCKQPCRRIFTLEGKKSLPYSLKDMETIDFVPQLAQMGIHSLKVEGRLKSVNYVYQVAQSYKMVINDSSKLEEAKALLEMDMGRKKTNYFLGGSVSDSNTEHTHTGIPIGQITKNQNKQLWFTSSMALEKGDRIRVSHYNGTQTPIALSEIKYENGLYTTEKPATGFFQPKNQVFLISRKEQKIKGIEEVKTNKTLDSIKQEQKNSIIKQINNAGNSKTPSKRLQIFVRINTLDWIKKVQFQDIDGLYLQLTINELNKFKTDVPFIKKHIDKIFIELPPFISENNISNWDKAIKNIRQQRIKRFVISHLSQKSFFSKNDFVVANENVYTFNDAAIATLREQGIKGWTYPLESDMENLKSYKQKNGLVPIYFRPHLFISRMPAKIDQEKTFIDDYKLELQYIKHDNLNYTIPVIPVSFTQYTKVFKSMGYNRFLVDFSFESTSSNHWKNVLKKINTSEQIHPSHDFNIKSKLL